ncbi:MAG: hypothetical protein UT33_C0011G0120 [Candidatus Peregrinibacteria bacterium GW2011_GWC2_39_14]|nr:MAG: hypothetical protein UT33_C0011G0120 [Candidatus Peregrinibacteria bacterium GW2011_GWC2_39_14]
MFDKVKDMYKLQKEAKEIKKKLKNIHIEATQDGFTVVMDGEFEVISVTISDEAMADAAKNKKGLEGAILKCLNKATKKAQQVAAEEMKGVMGQMGLGG